MAVPEEQLEQMVGTVKQGLPKAKDTILAVSKARPPPIPKMTSAACTSGWAAHLSILLWVEFLPYTKRPVTLTPASSRACVNSSAQDPRARSPPNKTADDTE